MKNFILLLTVFFFIQGVYATSVSIQIAKQVAIGWYTNYAPKSITDYSVKNSQTMQMNGINTVYIFNFNAGGYVIVSTDDRMPPIYGYAFNYAEIDLTKLDNHEADWLYFYSARSYVDITNNYINPNTNSEWNNVINGIYLLSDPSNSVSPLLEAAHSSSWATWTHYFTGAPPYPSDFPSGYNVGDGGCVPLAMSQIMKYHKFPIHGTGNHTDIIPDQPNHQQYYVSTLTGQNVPITGSFSCDFSTQTYDYNLMPYALTWAAQPDPNNPPFGNMGWGPLPTWTQSAEDEVGKFQYQTGIACDMQWYAIGTWNTANEWAQSMVTYFKYLPNYQYITPGGSTPDGFKEAIRNEIKAGRPVLFSYQSSSYGRHCIVVDGFEMTNFFHKVHGDGGYFDGYFYLFPADNDGIHQQLGLNTYHQAAIHLEPNPCEVNAYYTQDYNFFGGSLVFWNPINSKRGVNTIHVFTGAQLTINTEVSLLSNAQIIVENGGILNLGSNCKLYNTCNGIWSGNLTIKGGGIVNIQNGVQIYLGGTGKIIVEPGGKFIMNGGKISSPDNIMWQGIEVQGNKNLPQTEANQGVVELLNGATIENALIAIETIKKTATGSMDFNFTGGIVKANGAIFRNNQSGIQIRNYHNTQTNGAIASNKSYILNCIFETTANLVDPTKKPNEFIRLDGCEGIRIAGNTFQNTNPVTVPTTERGNGIMIYDARCSITDLCLNNTSPCTNSKPNTFFRLNYGILVNPSNSLNSIIISRNVFNYCRFCILLKGVKNSIITSNKINPYKIGLSVENSTGFTIEDNEFFTTYGGTFGCIIFGTGTLSNSIYKNKFHDIPIGIQAQDFPTNVSNSGLQIKCNNFISNISAYDIAISSGAIGNPQGICGSITSPANNLFSSSSSSSIFTNQGVTPFTYNYYPSSTYNTFPHNVGTSVTVNACPQTQTWTYTAGCPSTIGGGVIPNPNNLITSIATLNSQLQTLNSTIDGGSTQNLLNKIYSNMSPGQLKNALLAPGPYLTDTVLIATIKRPSSLPPGILKNIIVPNSPVTTKVMTALNTVNLPAGIKQDIQAVQIGTSARAILEQQISELKQEKDFSVSELMRYYVNDSITKIDSAIIFLKTQTDLDSKRQLVQAYLLKNDCSNATATINSLPQQTADDAAFKQFYTILATLCTQGKTVFDLTPSQLQTINTIVATNTSTSSAAKSVLALVQNIFFPEIVEPLIVPDNLTLRGNLYNNPTCNNNPVINDTIVLLDSVRQVVNLPSSVITDASGYFKFNFNDLIFLDQTVKYTFGTTSGEVIQDTIFKTVQQWITASPVNLTLKKLTAGFINDTVLCFADTVHFTNKTMYGKQPYTSSWNFGDSPVYVSHPSSVVSHKFPSSGIFPVTLIATDALGCKDTALKQLIIPECPGIFGYISEHADCGGNPIVNDTLYFIDELGNSFD
ncbi:MAG: C10 family peptidase, partial [Bacteroidia bacterium]|nr:C10 family peptidase [Bacteroidia bacterium]